MSALAEVLRQWPERLEPSGAVAPERECRDDDRGEREPEVADLSSLPPCLQGAKGKEDERDPLDRDRAHPCRAGPLPVPGRPECQGAEDERHHPRVVVPAAGKVDGEERIPADKGRGEGLL